MKKLTLDRAIRRMLNHYDGDTEVTPEVASDLGLFLQGQAEPHAVFRTNDVGVLCCAVTGRMEATFPAHKLSGYPTPMDALKSATAWALSAGALTYEWLPHDPVQVSGTTDVGSQCDWPNCHTFVPDNEAYYIDHPFNEDKRRVCQYHYGRAGGTELERGKADRDKHEELANDDLATAQQREVDCTYGRPSFTKVTTFVPDPDDLATITDLTLDRHSSLWQVVRCMQNAIKQMSDNEHCYADDEEGTTISHEEVDVIVNHLTHGNEWSAIQYSDFMDMEEDS